MLCANCKNEALYEYRLTQESSLYYCGKHLPRFLEARKKAHLITVTEKLIEENQSALETLAPEPEPEPIVEEKPAPKKKSAKKKAE